MLQARLDPRQNPAHGAGAAVHGRVERENGRGFGNAVSFQNAKAEFFYVKRPRRWSHRFSARHDIADRAEIICIGHPRIAGQECIGAK